MKKIVVDTGVFVALFDKKDKNHIDSVNFIEEHQNSILITTESVITETVFLLDFEIRAQIAFLKWLSVSSVRVSSHTKNDYSRIQTLMEKYSNLPMDYADATIVNTLENEGICHVATFDSDFKVYRLNGKEKIENLLKYF